MLRAGRAWLSRSKDRGAGGSAAGNGAGMRGGPRSRGRYWAPAGLRFRGRSTRLAGRRLSLGWLS